MKTIAEAADILHQIESGKWKWMKQVKRYRPEEHVHEAERLKALEAHHVEETRYLVEVVKDLCELIATLPKQS